MFKFNKHSIHLPSHGFLRLQCVRNGRGVWLGVREREQPLSIQGMWRTWTPERASGCGRDLLTRLREAGGGRLISKKVCVKTLELEVERENKPRE